MSDVPFINLLTLVFGEVFIGVKSFLSEVKWKVKAWPLFDGGVALVGVVLPVSDFVGDILSSGSTIDKSFENGR